MWIDNPIGLYSTVVSCTHRTATQPQKRLKRRFSFAAGYPCILLQPPHTGHVWARYASESGLIHFFGFDLHALRCVAFGGDGDVCCARLCSGADYGKGTAEPRAVGIVGVGFRGLGGGISQRL